MPVFLKAIELNGFKSFPGKTRFEFVEGITGIVGPNGCGKSNVVEAIKWVLGEQSPKNLRGKKMEDIIFHGSENRSPTGMADVNLIFNNENKWLPIDYAEVSVGRRIFRSGEGEYYLNKSRIRLRDMIELFLDTGIGRDSYAIFEQGKLDRFLSESPQERRTLFEDFAGISRFKFRREEAERKLENSRQNIERVNDIIIELEKEVVNLKAQAEDAYRYNELREKLTACELKFEAIRVRNVSEEIEKRIEQKNTLSAKLNPLIEELRGKEDSLLQTENDIQSREESFAQFNTSFARLERDFAQTNSDLKNHTERVVSLESHLNSMDSRLKTEEERLESLKTELSAKEKDFERVSAEKSKTDEILGGIQSEIDRISVQIKNLDDKILARSNELGFGKIIDKDDIDKLREEIVALQARQEEYRNNLRDKWETLRGLEKEKNERNRQFEKAGETMNRLKSQLEDYVAKIEGVISREKDIKQQNVNHSAEIKNIQSELKSMDKVIMESLEKQSGELKKFADKKPLLEAKMESAVNKLYLSIERGDNADETRMNLDNLKSIFEDYKSHYESILGILYSDEGTYTRKENMQNRIEELSELISSNEQELEKARGELRELQTTRADIANNYSRSEYEYTSVRREIEKLDGQIETNQSSLKELENRINSNTEQINAKQQSVDKMNEIVTDYETEIRDLRAQRASLMEKINNKKIEFARTEEQFKSMGGEINRIKYQIKDIERMKESYQSEKTSTIAAIEDLKAKIEKDSRELEELKIRIEESKKEIENRKTEIEKLKSARKTLDIQIRDSSAKSQKIELEISSLETSVSERKQSLDNIIENIRNSYNIDINTVEIDKDDNLDELASLTKKTRNELNRLGDVNLLAVEQYQEVKERLEFLNGQKADIESAMEDIQAIIDETNQKSVEQFISAFEDIRKAFKKMFMRLFDGGKADMVLTDKDNILESGVDILAQPPGKKLQSVSLMSGGERALVVIAVVFAILYLKPTPFVVLDELDAPLDDDNIERFKRLLDDFKSNVQFILVSHSKSTLEICDTLYGVTMEERGVSKMINVAFDNAELLFKDDNGNSVASSQ
jgi:chromosome segregation protein